MAVRSSAQASSCLATDRSLATEELGQLLYTPETSGGLLIAVSPDLLPALQDAFRSAGHECWIVGEVAAGSGVAVTAD